MLKKQILEFIADPGRHDFDELARRAFDFQYERLEPLRNLCQTQGLDPSDLEDWRSIPAVPVMAYKSIELSTEPAETVFRSSGTTEDRRSMHHHGFLDVYRATIDASFPAACLGPLERPPMLALIPSRLQQPESSLSFMIDHVLQSWGDPLDSLTAFGERGIETRELRSFLAARQRDSRPLVILSSSFALAETLEVLDRYGLRFRLPPGSVIFETGGYKGRRRELKRPQLLEMIEHWLAVPDSSVVREYGMTELTSQLYTEALSGGDLERFVPPPWVRVRILDPSTLAELPPGKTGLICIFDLANLSSAVQVLTQDLGRADDRGFFLVGRAVGAELRGCSLVVEGLAG